jgi:hypothetical protein
MKRIPSIFLALMLTAFTVHADENIHIDGNLTQEQKAELALQAAKLVTANKNANNGVPAPVAVDTVKKWADIGTAIGSSLASSARQLGVAANDFAQTPVGKLTMAVIVWHFIGGQLVHIVFGAMWLVIAIPLWVYFYRRASSKTTITVYEAGKGPAGATKITVRAPCAFSNDDDYRNAVGVIFVLSLLMIVMIGVITVFTF